MKVEPRTLWKAIVEEATHTGGCGSLPSSWRWVKLGDVVLNSVSGGTPEKIRRQYWGGSIHWASVKDLRGDTLDTTQDFITEEGLQKSSAKLIPAGNIIVCMRMALGKIVINTIDTAINQDLRAVFLRDCVLQKYFFYVFKSLEVTIKNKGRGTTVNGITLKDLYSLPFPLPPIDEQREIVARLEPLLREVEELDEHYQRYKHAKEVFRKAAIQDAVHAKDDVLPAGWRWVRLGDVVSLRSGVDLTKLEHNNKGEGIPYIIGASNFEDGEITITRWTTTPKTIAHRGEILFTCKGTVGEVAILQEEQAHIARQVWAVIPHDADTKYIVYVLLAKAQYLKSKAWTFIPGIRMKVLRDMVIPLPPKDQQLRIVSYLDQLTHQLDNMP